MSTQTKRKPGIIDALIRLFADENSSGEAVLSKEQLESQKKADKIVLETVEPIVEAKASKSGKSGNGYSKKQLDDFTDRLKSTTNKSGKSNNIEKQQNNNSNKEDKTIEF